MQPFLLKSNTLLQIKQVNLFTMHSVRYHFNNGQHYLNLKENCTQFMSTVKSIL